MSEAIRPGSLCIRVTERLEDLESIAREWDELSLACPQELPMLAAAWVVPFLKHRLPPDERWVCLLALSPAGELQGVLPLTARTVRFPRHHEVYSGLSDDHTRSCDVLARAGMEGQVLSEFLGALAARSEGMLGTVLRGVIDRSPTFRAVEGSAVGRFHAVERRGTGYVIRTEGTFEAYLGTLASRLRKHTRQGLRKLAERRDFKIHFSGGAEALEVGLPAFLALEAAGWKGREQTAILSEPSLVAFYSELCARLAGLGWLQLHLLEADRRLIAAHLAVHMGRSLVILKIAYDESYRMYSPGSCLLWATLERAFGASDVDEINLLSCAPWMVHWRPQVHSYEDLWFFPPRAVPLVVGFAPKRLRAALRAVPGLPTLSRRLRQLWWASPRSGAGRRRDGAGEAAPQRPSS